MVYDEELNYDGLFDKIMETFNGYSCSTQMKQNYIDAFEMYFKYGMTYKEIGKELFNSKTEKLGLSADRTRQIVAKGLRMLRHPQNKELFECGFRIA